MRRFGPIRLFVMRTAMVVPAMAGLSGAAMAAAPYLMDDAFRASIEGVQKSLSTGDVTGAQQRAQALASSADKPLEKYVAGELLLQAAVMRGDYRAQRAALNVILESGETPAKEAAKLRGTAGVLSAMLGDRKDAIAQIDYANGQGYSTITTQVALADAKFARGDAPGAAKALDEAFQLSAKENKAIDTYWYDRGIALAYKAKRFDLVARWTQAKLAAYSAAPNWRSGITNYMTGANVGPDQSLDLYRLMAATDGIASERDWLAYSNVAGQKGSAAEAKAALDTGVKAGDLEAGDPNVQKLLTGLKPKAAKALAEIPVLTTKAAKGNGSAALAAADAHFAAAGYPAAVELYRSALTKGGVDSGLVNTRLGIAQARSGDLAGGKATLAGVTDSGWTPVAGFWTVWIDKQLTRNPA